MEENTKEMIVIDNVDRYNEIFGLETRHPLVSIIDLAKSTTWPTRAWFRYEVYALYLKNVKCGDIKYGRQYYDYQDGTIVCFAPGQITDLEMLPNIQPNAHGILFHPDLIRGTALGQEIKILLLLLRNQRSTPHFRRRTANCDGLPAKITIELEHSIDKHSRRLICANIGLLLDYCMRFYERQFDTRNGVNKDIIVRFEHLLNEYFEGDAPQNQGLPSVKYFADKVFLSVNYFSDMVRKQTGKTVSEYIQDKMIGLVKEQLLSTDKTTSQIAYEIGFQYPQHLSRMFKRVVGMTPNKFRLQF